MGWVRSISTCAQKAPEIIEVKTGPVLTGNDQFTQGFHRTGRERL